MKPSLPPPHPSGQPVPGLRSPYEQVAGLYFLGRSLDKMRLHAAGRLPGDYVPFLGDGYDLRLHRFLRIEYARVRDQVVAHDRPDEVIAEWIFRHGRRPEEWEKEMWNHYIAKRGWRDEIAPRVEARLREGGFPPGLVQTMFDFFEVDEGRRPRSGEPL